MSSSLNYDFPKIVYVSRAAQIVLALIELLILFSGVPRTSAGIIAVYMLLLLVDLYILIERIANNTDGRYDLRQIVRVHSVELRIRYFITVFYPLFAAIILFTQVEHNAIFSMCAITQVISSAGLLLVEFYEVMTHS